ncbi:hypothetical protein RQP46_001145 [Phenoliferia psychrophenolica]
MLRSALLALTLIVCSASLSTATAIGDAAACSFRVLTAYTTPVKRWTQWGEWYQNCESSDVSAITATVSSAVSTGNTVTNSSSLNIGLDIEGISLGLDETYSESWTTTNTITQTQQIVGNLNLIKNFLLATGSLMVNYKHKHDGHWFWFEDGIDVYTLADKGDTVSANVAACGVLSQPADGSYFYNQSDMDATRSGPSTTYTYSGNQGY